MDKSQRLDVMSQALLRLAKGEPGDFVIFTDRQQPENYVQLTQDGLIEVTSRDYPNSHLPKLTAEQIAAVTYLGFGASANPNHQSTADLSKPEAIAALCEQLFNILGSTDTFILGVSTELVDESAKDADPERRAVWRVAGALMARARKLRQERLYPAAVNQFEAAVAKVRTLNSVEDTRNASRQLGDFLDGIGSELWRVHNETATSYLEQAICAYRDSYNSEDSHHKRGIVQALRTLGDIYVRSAYKQPDYMALERHHRAISVFEELIATDSDSYDAMHAMRTLAELYDKVDDVENGQAAYRRILPMIGKNKWAYGQCLSFFLRHNLLTDLSVAARTCGQNISDMAVAEHFSDRVLRLIWSRQFAAADRLLHHLLAVTDTIEFPMERSKIVGLLGYCQERRGDIDKALDTYRNAIENGSGDQFTFTRLLINLQQLKLWAEALALVDLGLSIATDENWKSDLERRRDRMKLKVQRGS